eukprot:1605863-Prymnesium_polylepis.1
MPTPTSGVHHAVERPRARTSGEDEELASSRDPLSRAPLLPAPGGSLEKRASLGRTEAQRDRIQTLSSPGSRRARCEGERD